MFLIVGLGNPGEKYKKTRHNIGFILLDEVVSGFEKDKYANALVAKDSLGNKEVIFVKPETYMNESGRSVSELLKRYEIPSENIFVVYDDIDLPMADLRISFDRGDGGHNGIKSVAAALGTRAFLRLRVGIAPRGEDGRAIKPKGGFFTSQSRAVSNFVLKDFSASDLEKIKSLAPKVKKIIETFVKEGREKVMNEFN
jgi:PTH1 family peptidyl-tRNA hydrolase